tara:strand:+ start:1283 stop:2197 length:915 start_codon:yes stop_codon:yes gene_type:complete
MKIAFFTEGGYQGKVHRNHPNMRTELAWMCALNADHWNINQTPNQKYDLGIVIIPKKNPHFDLNKIKQYCNQTAVMQEGPNWYWQDYPLNQQIWYYNTIQEADFMFVHNQSDKKYYEGLTDKECKILPSLMIEDSIKNLPQVERKDIIIGGNFCSWYGGFDSYIVAQEADCPIYIPSMGRKIEDEEQMPNLNHLSYMNWVEWIKTLNNFKYGVHLMRTHAAGTFALNCAYLGIPCIGYEGLDTQEICHPYLTVKLGDLATAKEKITLLKTDENFYNKCVFTAQENYLKYNEQNFANKWKKYIQK